MVCRFGLLLLLCGPALATPLGTAINYQGQLKESGQPASGLYDLQVCVFDGAASAIPLACAPDFDGVPVEAGLFTIALDFGASTFVGEQRYLELRVRPGASIGGYTTLAPRQPIRATPEALRAAAASAAPWSGLTGVPADFADGIDNAGAGTVTSVSAGAGLSGGTITASGTLAVDTAVVQSRISGVCVVGQYVRQVNADGTVLCGLDSAGGGTVTSIATAGGLTGGPITESGIIAIADGGIGLAQIDPTQVQARIGGTCALGSYLRGINADGSLLCTELQGATTFATLTPTGTAVLATAIAIGTDGLPVIAFYYGDVGALDLGVAKCSNRNCSAGASLSIVDDGGGSDVGSQLSIAVPPDGLPIIAYYDSTNTSLKTAKCSNAACTGFGSAVIKTIDNSATVGLYASVAIGADALPVISYFDLDVGDLKVAKCTDPTCSNRGIVVVDGPGIVGQFSSIAVPDDGLPVIAYQAGASTPESRRLAIAKCLDPACSSSTRSLIDSGPNAGHISIAIGHDGLPIVAHSRGLPGTLSGAWAIPVIRCATPACDAGVSTSVLSPGPNTAVSARLAIGSDGSPVIVYEKVSSQILENAAIEVTRCLDTECSAFAVPTRVDAGGISPFSAYSRAIAVASDGLPIVSYLDDSARLRVAKCGTLDCR